MATTRLFLDTRYRRDANGLCTVKIGLNHRGKSTTLLTDVRIRSDQWDASARRVVNHPKRSIYNRLLVTREGQVNRLICEIAQLQNLRAMSAVELGRTIRYAINGGDLSLQAKNSIRSLFERYIATKGLRENSKSKYDCTLKKISSYVKSTGRPEPLINDINLGWIEGFEQYMASTGIAVNTRRIYHASLKAVINYAIDNEITDRNGYRRFAIKTERTAKRNLSVEGLRMIIDAQLPEWMERYRDFFLLSFMLRGLNTVDLCRMEKPVNGRLECQRTKTGQSISIKVEPEMEAIIRRHEGGDLLLCFAENRNYRSFNQQLTMALHKMVAHINETSGSDYKLPDITMYWARHSWATIADRLDIPFDVIGAGLAHSPKSVTEVYIERDAEKVDRANRRILDYVFYGRDYRESSASSSSRG